ncbi:hypothetical protein BGZ98_007792, partial [Dissophora globulifera]
GFVSWKHEGDKVLAFDRAGAVFIFNFHSTRSFTDYRIAVPSGGKYRVLLNSDEKHFGGHARVSNDSVYFSTPETWAGRDQYIQVYIPCRTALILVKAE